MQAEEFEEVVEEPIEPMPEPRMKSPRGFSTISHSMLYINFLEWFVYVVFFEVCVCLEKYSPGSVGRHIKPNEPKNPPSHKPEEPSAADVVETAAAVAGLPAGSTPASSGAVGVARLI